MSPAHRWTSALILLLLPATWNNPAAARQSPADDFARRQAEQNDQQRLDDLKKITPQQQPAAKSEAPTPPPAAGACFEISHVELDGVTRFSTATVDKILAAYRNKCVGVAEINILMRDITSLYLDGGYVTSRVFVPAQDIAGTKVLKLVAVEGKLADIYINGKPAPGSGMLATAFPRMKDHIANLRDIEQGLDQINRLQSNKAKTAMLPGKDEGTSILNIQNIPDHPWHASVANNNLGQEQTGYSSSTLSLGYDDLLGLNDEVDFAYGRTGPDYPWRGDGQGRSNSYSGSASIPYGYWTLSANGSLYDYESTVPGAFGSLETSGNSRQFGVSADRVILRDKDSITTVSGGLTYKETDNFLLGSKIEVGSRRYAVGSLSISHSRHMLGGVWVFDLSYDQGLNLFDAVDAGDIGAGDADPRFSKFTATISITQPFDIDGHHLEISSVLTGQYSPDNVFGAEQISIGGYSNVRGTREAMLFGNDGLFSRNDFIWRTQPWADNAALVKAFGELRPYVGLDYGCVPSQANFNLDGGDMLSWTVGAKLAGGHVNLDVGYSNVLAGTIDQHEAGLFFASTSVRW
jgi:hemolysin activation/secretion protein